jgi:predicted small lipoprotein YifL
MTILLLLFSGCGKKLYIPPPYQFKKTEEIKPKKIRVFKEDKLIYKKYIVLLRKTIKFYEKQIDRYYKVYKDRK